jgi:hypothetical protein
VGCLYYTGRENMVYLWCIKNVGFRNTANSVPLMYALISFGTPCRAKRQVASEACGGGAPNIYSAPQKVVLWLDRTRALGPGFSSFLRILTQDPGFELPRNPFVGSSMNKSNSLLKNVVKNSAFGSYANLTLLTSCQSWT